MLRQQRQRHRRQEGQIAHHSVAAAVAPGAARARAQREAFEAHRIAVLEQLGIGDAGIGHVSVHGTRAGEAGAGAGAAADGLVETETVVAEEHVVHRPLAASRQAQRLEQRVDQALAGLDVAADHRRGLPGIVREGRIEHPRRHLDVDRAQQALVERQRLGDQQPQHGEHGAAHHRRRRVEVARMHAGGAGEVDPRAARADLDAHRQRRAVVQPLDGFQGASRQAGERGAEALLGAAFERLHVEGDDPAPGRAGQGAQGLGTAVVGGGGGAQVGEVLLDGTARKGPFQKQPPELRPARLAPARQVGGRDDHSFFGEAACTGRHRAGPHAADLGVVSAAGDVAEQRGWRGGAGLGVAEDGRDHRHVRQMGTAETGMIGHHHVARLERQRRGGQPHADAERAEMHRDVRRVDHQLAGDVEQRAREVETLLDVRRDGGALQALAHLARDGREAVGEQLELDGGGGGAGPRSCRLRRRARRRGAASVPACRAPPRRRSPARSARRR